MSSLIQTLHQMTMAFFNFLLAFTLHWLLCAILPLLLLLKHFHRLLIAAFSFSYSYSLSRFVFCAISPPKNHHHSFNNSVKWGKKFTGVSFSHFLSLHWIHSSYYCYYHHSVAGYCLQGVTLSLQDEHRWWWEKFCIANKKNKKKFEFFPDLRLAFSEIRLCYNWHHCSTSFRMPPPSASYRVQQLSHPIADKTRVKQRETIITHWGALQKQYGRVKK